MRRGWVAWLGAVMVALPMGLAAADSGVPPETAQGGATTEWTCPPIC